MRGGGQSFFVNGGALAINARPSLTASPPLAAATRKQKNRLKQLEREAVRLQQQVRGLDADVERATEAINAAAL